MKSQRCESTGTDESGAAALLVGLTGSQRHAVCVDAAPLCILAGPGSGKTRVLTRRIAWRVAHRSADASHVLALTFTRKAAGELRRRLGELGVRDQVAAGTFHSVAYAQLRQRWADRGEVPPTLLERKAALLARLGGAGGPTGARLLGDVAGEIEWAKARLLSPADYPAAAADAGRRPALPTPEVARLFAAYEAEKSARRLVDFDDLLSHCATAIESDAAFAAAQRWRFRHIFVDEYQDVNPSQQRLLAAWLGGRCDLCVVGDPSQAIYGWNGADPGALLHMTRSYAAASVVRLDDNWRSSPQVLAVASAVLTFGRTSTGQGGAGQGGAGQGGLGSRGRGGPTGMRANRPDGPVPTVTAYESDRAEALGIARGLRTAHRPRSPWCHMAVLVRTNTQLALVEEALQAAGIPHRVRGGQAFLSHPVVKDVLQALAGSPNRAFSAVAADLAAAARRAGAPSLSPASGNGGIRPGDLPASSAEEEAGDTSAVLDTVVRLAAEYASLDPGASVEGFQAWLAVTVGSERGEGERDAVELATFHRAKGLEWPVVFVAGLEQGLVPIGQATTPASQAEEQRLLYVALTRAEVELHCSWAKARTFGTRTVRRGPSPYLEAIGSACAALEGRAVPGSGAHLPGRGGTCVAKLLAPARSRLREASAPGPGERPATALSRAADPEVIEALRSWRSATARASGVPAYVILHDSTLASVALAMPASTDELLSLPGLGPVKGARYGPALLDVLAGHRRASA